MLGTTENRRKITLFVAASGLCVAFDCVILLSPNLRPWSNWIAAAPFLIPIVQSVRVAQRSTGELRRCWFLWTLALSFALFEVATTASPILSVPCDLASLTLCLFVVAMPILSERRRLVRAFDVALVLALCTLSDSSFLLNSRSLLQALNLSHALLFVAALLATRAATSLSMARLMRLIAIYQWFCFMASFVLNQVMLRWLHHSGITPLDWLRELPPIAFVVAMAFLPFPSLARTRPSPYLVHSALPLLFTLTLLALSGWMVSLHIRFGWFVASLALTCFAFRAFLAFRRSPFVLTEPDGLAQPVSQLPQLDPLTGLGTLRTFTQALEDEWAASPLESPFSVVRADVDFFHQLNEELGQEYADSCLNAIAAVLEQIVIAPRDALSRIDSDEFALLLPRTDLPEALDVGDAICREVRNLALYGAGDRIITVSVGIGLCKVSPSHGPAAVYDEAERSLAHAKRLGRNRAEFTTIPSSG